MTTAAADNAQVATGRQIPIVCPGHTRPLAELQFCYVKEEGRTFLVSACHDKRPMLRDGTTGDWIGTWAGHKGAVWSTKLDPTGSLAATASGDFSVSVWDAITGSSLWNFPHKHIVKTCDFSPDSKRLATGGHEGILRIYNLTRPKEAPLEIVVLPTSSSSSSSSDAKITISKCTWLSESVVLSAGSDGIIRFWNVEADNNAPPPTSPIYVLETEGAEIRDLEVQLVESGQKVLTVATGSKVFFFDVEEKKLLHVYSMPIHFREEGGASLHPSGTKFIAGGSDLWVRVFDFATGKELECHKGHHGPIRCVRYSPDGTLFATGSEDGTIRLWKTTPE